MNDILGSHQGLVLIFLFGCGLFLIWRNSRSHPNFSDRELYEKAWWVIVTTEQPNYKYSFGPFDQRSEAVAYQSGYVKDLYDEGATQIQSTIRWYQPQEITIDLGSSSI